MSDDLKPCPFCQSTDIDPKGVAYYPFGDKNRGLHFYPACNQCCGSSENWNTRPQEDAKDKEIEHLKLKDRSLKEALELQAQNYLEQIDAKDRRIKELEHILLDIHQRSTRNKRACGFKKYLQMDLEYIAVTAKQALDGKE